MPTVRYTSELGQVDWAALKSTLHQDAFDNGRTPAQLRKSFENSQVCCLAYIEQHIIGTARALSDGICNAYVVDVWTFTPYRRQGIARTMVQCLLTRLEGQHVYLFTDQAVGFYRKLGFVEQSMGMGQVVGTWLHPGAVVRG
jgi:ribosomal protein S18 acetylase RimI-like enzyme